jgi:glyoxylase-like metal-dependent hydrolase (beta-lactamase superfamily II)
MSADVAPEVRFATVGAFQENTYLVVDPATRRAILVDPGAEPDTLIALVESSGAVLEAIWLTHAHLDHVGGIAGVKRRWDVPVHLHPADRPLYDNAARQAAAYGLPFEQPGAPERELAEGTPLTVGGLSFAVHHTPGHAPGHCVFLGHGVMLGGDLLFAGSIGRTDLPLSDPAAMQRSLEHVAGFPPPTVVYPGHGPHTTIGAERATNGFLTGLARVAARQ